MTINFQPEDGDTLRQRLRAMTDEQLIRFGKAAEFMSREKNQREVFVTELKEAWEDIRMQANITDRTAMRRMGTLYSFVVDGSKTGGRVF
jgi:hypothetical protein